MDAHGDSYIVTNADVHRDSDGNAHTYADSNKNIHPYSHPDRHHYGRLLDALADHPLPALALYDGSLLLQVRDCPGDRRLPVHWMPRLFWQWEPQGGGLFDYESELRQAGGSVRDSGG